MRDDFTDHLTIALGWLVTAALALLWGCTPAPQSLPPSSRAAGAAVLQGWSEAGLPDPKLGRGGCDVRAFRVSRPSVQDYVLKCSSYPSDNNGETRPDGARESAGCLSWDSSGHWFRSVDIPIVVVAPGWEASTDELIVHELLHALYRCADLPYWTQQNVSHLDPRVWEATGGEESAQGRARRLVGL